MHGLSNAEGTPSPLQMLFKTKHFAVEVYFLFFLSHGHLPIAKLPGGTGDF